MKYKYKNLFIEFEWGESNDGDYKVTLPAELADEFLMEDAYNLYDPYLTDDEELLGGFRNEEDPTIRSTKDPDQAIVLYHWMINQPDRNFYLDITGDSIFWVFHDIQHARHDVSGGAVVVTPYAEELRMIKAAKIMVKRGLWHKNNWYDGALLLDQSEHDFQTRWNHKVNYSKVIKKFVPKKERGMTFH
jgi:hypothetical protein